MENEEQYQHVFAKIPGYLDLPGIDFQMGKMASGVHETVESNVSAKKP